jgi:hypothetical protein
VTGRPIERKKFYGKPNAEPYEMIEDLLREQAGAIDRSFNL